MTWLFQATLVCQAVEGGKSRCPRPKDRRTKCLRSAAKELRRDHDDSERAKKPPIFGSWSLPASRQQKKADHRNRYSNPRNRSLPTGEIANFHPDCFARCKDRKTQYQRLGRLVLLKGIPPSPIDTTMAVPKTNKRGINANRPASPNAAMSTRARRFRKG